MKHFIFLLLCCSAVFLSCTNRKTQQSRPPVLLGPQVGEQAQAAPQLPSTPPQMYGYRVVNAFLHDPTAFTQGLLIHNDTLYESTGLYGASSLRIVELTTGEVLKKVPLPSRYFGEGIAIFGDMLFLLTWREQTCFVYDRRTLELKTTLRYDGEGWGLTNDDKQLIMSNGTNVITFRSPHDFSVHRRLEVFTDKGPVPYLNELELINGELWANVFQTDHIVRIDTATGAVRGIVNLAGILPTALRDHTTDVLNGIAHNPRTGQIFVKGKNWQKLYEIKVE